MPTIPGLHLGLVTGWTNVKSQKRINLLRKNVLSIKKQNRMIYAAVHIENLASSISSPGLLSQDLHLKSLIQAGEV